MSDHQSIGRGLRSQLRRISSAPFCRGDGTKTIQRTYRFAGSHQGNMDAVAHAADARACTRRLDPELVKISLPGDLPDDIGIMKKINRDCLRFDLCSKDFEESSQPVGMGRPGRGAGKVPVHMSLVYGNVHEFAACLHDIRSDCRVS